MAIRQISKYIKDIQTKLFPALKNNYNLDMNENPTNISTTLATFNGQIDGDRIIFEFSSNHKDLADYPNEPVLFLYLYLNYKGTKAGIINLNNINEAVEIIYAALYELGYRTQEDINKEKERKRQEKEKKIQDEKERMQRRKEELLNQPEDDEENEVNNEENETQSSLLEMNNNFDRYLSILQQSNQINSQINATISYLSESNNYKIVNVYIYYITRTQCLVQTEGIKPKIDQQTTWDKAKNYLNKVTEKINGVIVLSAMDENGNDIELKPDEEDFESNNSNDIDSGINL